MTNNKPSQVIWISKKLKTFLFHKQSGRRNQTSKHVSYSQLIEEYIRKAEGSKYDKN